MYQYPILNQNYLVTLYSPGTVYSLHWALVYSYKNVHPKTGGFSSPIHITTDTHACIPRIAKM